MANDLLRGRQTVVPLTNKSGGAVAEGDVVIISSGTAAAFTTTTSAGLATDMIGVAIETIANDAVGRVCVCGYVAKITLSASASLGDTFGTHSVAKQAAPHSALATGDVGEVLGTGTTPAALLWGGMPFPNTTGMTNPMTTAGDLILGGVAGAAGRLAIGTANYVLTSNGTTAAWAASTPYICILDKKTQNTAGGTFTQGAWRTRDLNTELSDGANLASVASNQITLAAGTYIVKLTAPSYMVLYHQARLYDITNSAQLLLGTTEIAYSTSYTATRSIVCGKITLAGSTVLEAQHYCTSTYATYGFGAPGNITDEIYTTVEFWKVA